MPIQSIENLAPVVGKDKELSPVRQVFQRRNGGNPYGRVPFEMLQTHPDTTEAEPVIGQVLNDFEPHQISKGVQTLCSPAASGTHGGSNEPTLIPVLDLAQGDSDYAGGRFAIK